MRRRKRCLRPTEAEHDWPRFCQSYCSTHEWRVIAPFLSLPFLVNKHRPRIHTSEILDFFSVSPHSIHPWIPLSTHPCPCPSPSPSSSSSPSSLAPPPLHPAHLPGLPLPFCRTSGRYGVCRIACMHLNEKLHFVLLPSALILTFILFFFPRLLTLALCCCQGAAALPLVQGNSRHLAHLSLSSQSLSSVCYSHFSTYGGCQWSINAWELIHAQGAVSVTQRKTNEELTRLPLPGFTIGRCIIVAKTELWFGSICMFQNTFPVLQAWMKEP